MTFGRPCSAEPQAQAVDVEGVDPVAAGADDQLLGADVVEVHLGAVSGLLVRPGERRVRGIPPEPVVREAPVTAALDLDMVEDRIHDHVQAALVACADECLQP